MKFPLRWLVRLAYIISGVLIVAFAAIIFMMVKLDQQAHEIAAQKVSGDQHFSILQQQLIQVQSQLLAQSVEKTSLQDEVRKNMGSLQDVYFDVLKKNDGMPTLYANAAPGRWAYLSFDDGPSANTAAVLDVLAKSHIKATFFINGRPAYASVVQREVREGHKLGNHGYSHDYLAIYASVEAYLADVDKLDTWMGDIKVPVSLLYRFPGGAKNHYALELGGPDLTARISAAMAERGYHFYEWNVGGRDAELNADGGLPTAAEIASSILAEAKTRRIAVILLHDGPGHAATVAALPGIISGLRALGFSFASLP